MDLQLQDKVALVTGSSKGIGEAIVRRLAREGAVVIVHGRDKSKADEVARDIIDQGGRAFVVTGDLTRDEEVDRLIKTAQGFGRPVEILVNNAGGSAHTGDWAITKAESWTMNYDRNVLAAVRVTTSLLPAMREAGWGRIVNIASMAGLMPPPNRPEYAATKAAMIAMTSSLAKAVAAEGITVNTISPGTIRSGTLEEAFRRIAPSHGIDFDAPWGVIEEKVLPMLAQVPMQRVGTVEELADAVAFLVSTRASYITGTNLRLDGGMWLGL